jgi:hypothetical protein
MRVPWLRIATMTILLFALNGCKCNKGTVSQAFKTFQGFASGEEDYTVNTDVKPYEFRIRHRSVENVQGRERATADIEVDPAITNEKLEEILRDACHANAVLGGASAVKVRSWPGKLGKLTGPLGISVFARDGHGWDGKGVGFEQIKVLRPSFQQLASQGLSAISEDQYFQLLAVENLLTRGVSLEQAISEAAERHGLSSDDLHETIEHAQKVWGKPGS